LKPVAGKIMQAFKNTQGIIGAPIINEYKFHRRFVADEILKYIDWKPARFIVTRDNDN
jgi:hypothetical protein